MRREKPPLEIRAEATEIAQIWASLGKSVPLRTSYLRSDRPTFVAIDGDRCILRFRNGAALLEVLSPIWLMIHPIGDESSERRIDQHCKLAARLGNQPC